MSGPERIRVVGARRGQGATTVALAIASHGADTGRRVAVVVEDLDDACAVCGVSTPTGEGPALVATGLALVSLGSPVPAGTDLVVEDIGVAHADAEAGITVLVVRGPDFLSLRTALTHPIRCDGAVVVREPWRALDPADVSNVLGLPVLAEVPHSDEVARATDAGLLVCRAGSMRPFASLHRLVADGHSAVPAA